MSAHENQFNLIPALKTKSMSIHKLNPSNFRPARKTEVDFDPRTKEQFKLDPDLKPNQFRSRTKKTS